MFTVSIIGDVYLLRFPAGFRSNVISNCMLEWFRLNGIEVPTLLGHDSYVAMDKEAFTAFKLKFDI